MQNEEQLNKLFNLAREQEVLLNSDEFQELMNGRLVKKPTDKYQKFKAIKIKAMTISTLIIGIAATIGFFVNSNQKSIRKSPSQIVKTVIEPFENSLIETEENKQVPVSPPDITFNSKTQTTDDDTGKKKKIIIERKVIIADENVVIDLNAGNIPKDFSIDNKDTGKKLVEEKFIIKKNEGKDEPKSLTEIIPAFDKETFVVLTKEELKKLGIYIKDDVFMYEMDKTRIGNCKAFFGDNTAQSYSSTSNMEKKKGNNPLAMFATTVDGEVKDLMSLFHKPTKIEAYKIAPTLLPVWVEDETSKAGKPYIAWFEMNDTLANFLPERIQNNLKSDKTYYSHTLTDKNKRKDELKYTKQNIAIDKKQIVIPDSVLLKKLGFTSFNPIIYYRRNTEGELAINSNQYGTNMSTATGNWDSVKNSISTVFPSFISRYDTLTQSIHDLSAFNYNRETNELQYFNNKKYGMVGLWLKGSDADKVFWYDINNSILNELNPGDKKRIKEYAVANKDILKGIDVNAKLPEEKSFEEVANDKTTNSSAIKTITLNKAQLEKLLIRVDDNKVIQRIPISYKTDKKTGKQLAVELIFDKYGTGIKLDIPLDNFDSSSYIKPVWLSDDLGTWSRASFDSITYVIDKISSYNLIPVLVRSGQSYSTMDALTKKHRPDIIFWYKPTEKFLKILDTKIADEIRNDIVALTCNRSKIIFTTDSTCDGKSTLSCNYFEACQNTTSKAINKYSVFPNPAKDNFNLKLDLKEECSVLVYMFALNGAEVKQFPVGKMNKGISQKELSSEGITPGLYLLRITTDKGDIFNERIVIKE